MSERGGEGEMMENQVCCIGCKHLERVNRRIVDARCKVTGIAFPKYATDKALINPATFWCKLAKEKGDANGNQG